MKCYILSITNTCQKECPYCVMAKWRNNPEYSDKWDFASLIKWLLESGLQAGDHVQLTGGEPLMHSDCIKLIEWLHNQGCKILLLTNGLGLGTWRNRFSNMKCIIVKHDTADDLFNKILAFSLPTDRIDYELRNSIKSIKDSYTEPVLDEKQNKNHGYQKSWLMTNSGEVFMNWCHTDKEAIYSIWNFEEKSKTNKVYGLGCQQCPFMVGIWNELKGI